MHCHIEVKMNGKSKYFNIKKTLFIHLFIFSEGQKSPDITILRKDSDELGNKARNY